MIKGKNKFWNKLSKAYGGKRASQFKCTIHFVSLSVECGEKWQPNKLRIIWIRKKRRIESRSHAWQPGIKNPYRGSIVWIQPETIQILLTLYKYSYMQDYEDKEWSILLEDESTTGKRREVAIILLNMARHCNSISLTSNLTLNMRPTTKKIIAARLELTITSELMRERTRSISDIGRSSSVASLTDLQAENMLVDDEYSKSVAQVSKRSSDESNVQRHVELTDNYSHNDRIKSHSSPTLRYSISGGDITPIVEESESSSLSRKSSEMVSGFCETTKRNQSDILKQHTKIEELKSRVSQYALSVLMTIRTYIIRCFECLVSRVLYFEALILQSTKLVLQLQPSQKQDLLDWCQECTKDYENIEIVNMSSSWKNGLAFCAIIHYYYPELIPYDTLSDDNCERNCHIAFDAAKTLGVPKLLDSSDVANEDRLDKIKLMEYLFLLKRQLRCTIEDEPQYLETKRRKSKGDCETISWHDRQNSLPCCIHEKGWATANSIDDQDVKRLHYSDTLHPLKEDCLENYSKRRHTMDSSIQRNRRLLPILPSRQETVSKIFTNQLQSKSYELNTSGTARSIANYSQRRKLVLFEGSASIKRPESIETSSWNFNSQAGASAGYQSEIDYGVNHQDFITRKEDIQNSLQLLAERDAVTFADINKIEKELRIAINSSHDPSRNKQLLRQKIALLRQRNEITREQNELSLRSKENDLEYESSLIDRELYDLSLISDFNKSDKQTQRIQHLAKEKFKLVNERDRIVTQMEKYRRRAEAEDNELEQATKNLEIFDEEDDDLCCVQ
ncbi:EH domain-binding protein 1 [Trichoplax sp. H2]|nr:EH domain-binding protein 1 [Trichoplax sp. H2]|eukprot:RDD36551.1 EH domain-binding protein 1 [Trichoplax sp. H2]